MNSSSTGPDNGASLDRRREDGRPARWGIGEAEFDEGLGRITAAGQVHDLDRSSHALLRYLLVGAGRVASKEQLLKVGWPGRLATESSLTKAIHRLRLALNDPDGAVLCTVHGYGYRLVAPVENLTASGAGPSAELGPEHGDEAAPLATSTRTGRHVATRWLLVAVAGVLAFAAIFLGADWRNNETSAEAVEGATAKAPSVAEASPTLNSPEIAPSVAVLPFIDLSEKNELGYLGDGLAEELIGSLSRIPGLRVIARTSSFSFRDKQVDVPSIARDLGVSMILEGSVRQKEKSFVVSVKLVRAADGTSIWSRSFERNRQDVFAVPGEVSTDVANSLRLAYSGRDLPTRTVDLDAYRLLLQADAMADQGSREANVEAETLYRKVVQISPTEARAWLGLGRIYLNQTGQGYRPVPEGRKKAKDALHKALAIDPSLALGYARLAVVEMSLNHDEAAAAALFQRALEAEPGNFRVVGNVAVFLQNIGRLDESTRLREYVVSHDPVNCFAYTLLGGDYYSASRWDDSIAAYRTALRLCPDLANARLTLGTIYLLAKHDLPAAMIEFQAEHDEIARLTGLTMGLHALGRRAESDAVLQELIDKHGKTSATNIAMALAYRGNADRAFEWLERAIVDENPNIQTNMSQEPRYDNIKSDPRWLPFLRKVKRSPEQLKLIRFEAKLPN